NDSVFKVRPLRNGPATLPSQVLRFPPVSWRDHSRTATGTSAMAAQMNVVIITINVTALTNPASNTPGANPIFAEISPRQSSERREAGSRLHGETALERDRRGPSAQRREERHRECALPTAAVGNEEL